jgi:hypothetical protein
VTQLRKYKWCIHCKEFHLICYKIWEFRKNKDEVRIPYRCKIARRTRYCGAEKQRMARYYANMEPNRKIFVNERKKLRKQFNTGTITEEQFNNLVAESYKKYEGAINEKVDGTQGSSKSIPGSR